MTPPTITIHTDPSISVTVEHKDGEIVIRATQKVDADAIRSLVAREIGNHGSAISLALSRHKRSLA